MIVFGIHCNLFIVLPIRLKTCRSNDFLLFCFVFCFFTRPPEKLGTSKKFCRHSVPDLHRARNFPDAVIPLQKESPLKRVAIKNSHKNKTISLQNYLTLFSHVYLFVFRNDYEISGNKVFLSFVLKNLILIIKQVEK